MLAQVQFPFLSFENACCEKRRVLKKHKFPSTPSFYVLLYGHRFIKVKALCSIREISPECPPLSERKRLCVLGASSDEGDAVLVTEVFSAAVVNGCEQRGHRLLGWLCSQQQQRAAHQETVLDYRPGTVFFFFFF